jgi:hypothetical protein
MTEFCLVSRRAGVESVAESLTLKPAVANSFEGEVAAHLGLPISEFWTPVWRGQLVDDVLVNSRSSMIDGKPFEETDAFALFQELGRIASRVVCWYADYYDDLPHVNPSGALMELVHATVQTEECELYVDAVLDGTNHSL